MTLPAVVLFSGGQDSTTCLAWAIGQFGRDNVLPVSFEYGQRHAIEVKCAAEIADLFGVRPPLYLSVEALAQLGGAAITDSSIEVEAEASPGSGNSWAHEHGLPSTFVPGRNLVFLTLAAAYGARHGAHDLVTGVCEADAAGYPDCRRSFIVSAQHAISDALDDEIEIHAPLLELNKARTFALADELGILDVVIGMTHTCYEGNHTDLHGWGYGCGVCPACEERARGYREFRALV